MTGCWCLADLQWSVEDGIIQSVCGDGMTGLLGTVAGWEALMSVWRDLGSVG